MRIKRLTWLAYVIVLFAVLYGLWVFGSTWLNSHRITELVASIKSLGPIGPLLLIGIMSLHAFTVIPGEIILFAAMSIYGLEIGFVYAWIGSMIGSVLSFFLARYVGRRVVVRMVPEPVVQRFDEFCRKHGVMGMLALRLVPTGTYRLVNFGAGLTTVSIWAFVWTTGVGLVVTGLMLVGVYKGLLAHPVLTLLIVAILVIAGIAVRRLLKQNFER